MYRIIDANVNRVSEGLRVVEELCRFSLSDENLSTRLKNIRHILNILFRPYFRVLIESRNALNDIGRCIENPSRCKKKGLKDIISANIKRSEQGLRVLAEYIIDEKISDECEKLRYEVYDIEKSIFARVSILEKRERINNSKLYLVTNSDRFCNDVKFLETIEKSLCAGVDIVQLREKECSAKRIIELGKKIRELTFRYNALFIVNDRIDIAKIVQADGVHLGQDDISIEIARELLPEDKIIGISTHCIDQAKIAQDKGADYIGVGPVFTTPTKPGRDNVGIDYVKIVDECIDIPFFAIGGIDLENVDDVLSCQKNKRIAVVRAIMYADDPEFVTKTFKSKLL